MIENGADDVWLGTGALKRDAMTRSVPPLGG
jgi:hypothetical protein